MRTLCEFSMLVWFSKIRSCKPGYGPASPAAHFLCSIARIRQDLSTASFCSCKLLWRSDECVLLPCFNAQPDIFWVMNCCVVALGLFSSDISTWSANSLYSVQRHKIRWGRVEEYAYYVNELRQNVGLEAWIWRRIVTSQTAHTKYKWPLYATAAVDLRLYSLRSKRACSLQGRFCSRRYCIYAGINNRHTCRPTTRVLNSKNRAGEALLTLKVICIQAPASWFHLSRDVQMNRARCTQRLPIASLNRFDTYAHFCHVHCNRHQAAFTSPELLKREAAKFLPNFFWCV